MRFTVPTSGDGASSRMLILSSSQAPKSISLHLEEQKGRHLFSGDHSVSRPQVGHLTFMIQHSPGTDRTRGNAHNIRSVSGSVREEDAPGHQAQIRPNLTGTAPVSRHRKAQVKRKGRSTQDQSRSERRVAAKKRLEFYLGQFKIKPVKGNCAASLLLKRSAVIHYIIRRSAPIRAGHLTGHYSPNRIHADAIPGRCPFSL